MRIACIGTLISYPIPIHVQTGGLHTRKPLRTIHYRTLALTMPCHSKLPLPLTHSPLTIHHSQPALRLPSDFSPHLGSLSYCLFSSSPCLNLCFSLFLSHQQTPPSLNTQYFTTTLLTLVRNLFYFVRDAFLS